MNTTTKHTTQYKNSPLGLIPEDWEVKKFKEIAKFFSGGTPSTSIREYYEGNIPFIKSGEIYGETTEQFLNETALKNSSAKMVCKGDILYALYGANSGEVAISKIEGAINQAVLCVRTELNNLFTYNFLINNKDIIVKKYLQGGQGNLSADIVKKLDIPIPPITEQKAIADCLSTWDKAIEKQNALIAQKELAKKALMQQLLSGKRRLKGFEDQKGNHKTDFGYKIPKDWQIVTVSDLFVERHDKSNDQNEYPLFSLTIENGLTEKTERYERSFLLKDKENNQYKIVCPDDILFNPMNLRFGAIAKSEIDYKVLVSGYYNVIYMKDNFVNVNYFIELFKTAEFSNFYDRIAIGSLMEKKRVHLSNFLKLQVPLPSFEEQTAIAKVLQCADEELQLLKMKLEQLKEQKKGLMQVLLTGKKRLKF